MHRTIRKKLLRYIDNDVSPEEKAIIEKHLLRCASCGEKVRRLSKIWKDEREFERIKPHPFLMTKLLRRIDISRSDADSPPAQSEHIPSPAKAILVLIAMILTIGMGIRIGSMITSLSRETTAAERMQPEFSSEFGLDHFAMYPPGSLGNDMASARYPEERGK